MDTLTSLIENSNIAIVTAFLLGILTAISPCPLATNITAVGYISKNIESRKRIFFSGILYTVGRIITYTVIGFIIIPILREGSSIYAIQKIISKYGELLFPPILILIGVYMLCGKNIPIPRFGYRGKNIEDLKKRGYLGALLLGVLFSLAFCPISGVFYFGMLLPLAAAKTAGYLLPVVYALATGLPVIIIAWILAYSVSRLGEFYKRTQLFQKWLSRVVALAFITLGIYYAIIFYW